MLPFAHTGEVLAPLIGDDFGFDANFAPVVLDHFSDTARIRIIRALHRHRPEGDFGPFFQPGLFKEIFRFLRIVVVIGQIFLIARLLVGGIVERLPHQQVIERLFLGIKRQIADVERLNRMQRQIFITFNHRELYRRRRGNNLAFIGL